MHRVGFQPEGTSSGTEALMVNGRVVAGEIGKTMRVCVCAHAHATYFGRCWYVILVIAIFLERKGTAKTR